MTIPEILFSAAIFILLTFIFYHDLKYQRIPNKFVYPAMVLSFLLIWNSGGNVINSVIGFAIGLIVPIALILLFKANIGMGDVKLMALIGILVGFPVMFIAIGAGSLLGGVIFMVLSAIKHKRQVIPLAPTLIIAVIPCYIYHEFLFSLFVR